MKRGRAEVKELEISKLEKRKKWKRCGTEGGKTKTFF